jgi:hyperosmotically inducible protein
MQDLLKKGAGILAAFAMLLSLAIAQDSATKPDNTKNNKEQRSAANPTADQQKNNPTDRELTRDIRKAITSDKSLSTYARNVKVVAQNGSVTLRGPVRSEEEKQSIEQKAAGVAGAANVKNEITVVSADTSGKSSKKTTP